ncbi:hypothetical protein ES703_75305 [subsurface metagenome]
METPRFIKLKGCINCEQSKAHKEWHGTDYGFDHELVAGCLVSGCVDYGYDLASPFIDPDEAMRIATKKGDLELMTKAQEYADQVKSRFAQFYKRET